MTTKVSNSRRPFQVNDFNEWDTLAPLFGMPMACVNVGLALKQIYLR